MYRQRGTTAANISSSHFVVRLRSNNSWTPTDTVVCEALKGLPREFCNLYSLNKSAFFRVHHVGGHDVAMKLALQWCERYEWFFDLWTQREDDNHFTSEELHSYQADEAWVAFKGELARGSHALERADAIDATFPRNPA